MTVDVVDFARHLYKVLGEREDLLSQNLAHGGARDFEQYKQTVGEIQGIAYARSEIKALLEKSDDDVQDILDSG